MLVDLARDSLGELQSCNFTIDALRDNIDTSINRKDLD